MKKKKLLSISLLCLFGMVVAGCGGKPSSKEDSQPASENPSSEVAPASSVEPGTSEVGPASSSAAPSSVAPSSAQPSSEAPVNPTGVTLDKQSANIIKGQTLQLNATVAPANANNKEITWSSSDEDVITVSKTGLVTAVEVGSAKVTAKIKNTQLKAECDISVIKEINSITIKNKDAFTGFIVDDSDSLNIEIDPADNAIQLMNAGALKVTSSNTEIATVSGLTVTALKAGTATIKAELFGKQDSFELTVGEAIPGTPYSVINALNKGIVEAPWNGSTGKNGAITTTCFELTGQMIALAPNGATGYNAILDDGTQAVYLQINKLESDPIPFAIGDYAKVTCKFINYYGLLEGVSRKAATGDNASWIPSKDVEKIATPADAVTPTLNAPVAMSADEYVAYYNVCKTNGTKNAAGATWTALKYVSILAEYKQAFADADKGGYKISDDYGLAPIGSFQLDEPVEGHKSTLEAFLIGANTGKGKSNAIVTAQTPLAVESFTLDQGPQTIVRGNSIQLTYTTTPAGAYSRTVTWASSDETVATVENGLVTGVYQGEGTKDATISVTVAGNTQSVVITVFGESIPATDVAISESSLSLVEGQSKQLSATPTPAMVSDTAVWSSSDDTVATVDQAGNVKALKQGSANITVRYNASVAASCSLTVQKLAANTNYVGAQINTVGKLMAKNGKNAMIDDGTGGLFTYASAAVSANVGDMVSVSGTTKNYKGGLEIDSATVGEAPAGASVTPISATPITSAEVTAEIAAYKANSNYAIYGRKVSLRTGVIGGSGQYLTWSYGDALMETSISTGGMAAGKMYDVEGYLVNFYVSSGNYYLCLCVTSATEVSITATGVELDHDSLELLVGQSSQLTASILPEGASGTITWTSSDAAVATVSNAGLVAAVGAGTAKIRAALSETIYAECDVTVSDPGSNPVPQTVVMKYSGSTTANMTETGNAATVGLDATLFTVDAGKGEAANMPGLNKAGDMRLYSLKSADATGHGSFFVVTIAEGYTIQSIAIDFKQNAQDAVVYAGSTVVTGTDGAYTINASSFKVENGYKSDGSANTQVQINQISITYIQGNGQAEQEVLPLPIIPKGNQDTKVEGAGAWIYLDVTGLDLNAEMAAAMAAAAEIELTVSMSAETPESAQDAAQHYITGADAAVVLDGTVRFDDFGTNTVRLYIGMDKGLDPSWKMQHNFEISIPLDEETVFEGSVTFVGGELRVINGEAVAPVEIAQPIGNFSGYAVSASDSSNIFVHVALGDEKAYVEVGTLLKTTTTYDYDKATGLVTIALGGNFGNFTATYDEVNEKLENAGVDGAAAAMLSNNNSIELVQATKFWDCNGSTAELQAMFKRRYMSGSWQVDSSNTDRFVSYENGVAGSAMQRRGYSGGAVAVNLASDMDPVEVSNIGFWVYNPGSTDLTLRMWIYKGASLSNNAELGSVTAVAGQWTYCRMGFTKATIYNFQIADFNNSGVALVFDNISLF